jgi:hypothetical protein
MATATKTQCLCKDHNDNVAGDIHRTQAHSPYHSRKKTPTVILASATATALPTLLIPRWIVFVSQIPSAFYLRQEYKHHCCARMLTFVNRAKPQARQTGCVIHGNNGIG